MLTFHLHINRESNSIRSINILSRGTLMKIKYKVHPVLVLAVTFLISISFACTEGDKKASDGGGVFDMKALTSSGEKLDIKAITASGDKLDVKAFAGSGDVLDMKAITASGEKLDVKAFMTEGDILDIKALTPDGKKLDVKILRLQVRY